MKSTGDQNMNRIATIAALIFILLITTAAVPRTPPAVKSANQGIHQTALQHWKAAGGRAVAGIRQSSSCPAASRAFTRARADAASHDGGLAIANFVAARRATWRCHDRAGIDAANAAAVRDQAPPPSAFIQPDYRRWRSR